MSAIFLEFLHPPPPYQQYFCRISWQFWPIFDPSSLPIAKVVNGRPLKHTIYDKLNLSLPGQNGILVKFVAYSFIYCMYVVCTFITKLFIKIPPSANKVILGNEFSAWRNFKNIFSRLLFTIIFRPEMLKFHQYSILTGETMVAFVIFCVLNITAVFQKYRFGKFYLSD